MGKVALIIIYNHQYNKNIEILEEIYGERFSNIYHLVPFYTGEKRNVIPVYENSYYFQGYIAQGYKSFYNSDYDHYLFVADDLILNPIINERNYLEYLKLSDKTCFLPGFIILHEREKWWQRVGEAFRYRIKTPGVEAENQLPDYETALRLFNRFGLEIRPLKFNQIWRNSVSFFYSLEQIVTRHRSDVVRFINSLMRNQFVLSYPMVGSYSDICVVSAENIKLFCHYCGVFAATNLFVEVALPTSMVLSASEIITEENLELKGKALWTKEDYKLLNNYNNNLDRLLAEFPQEYLYLHPIKLSKWRKQ